MDSLFGMDTIREFIASQGGKTTNHDLVTHFRTFLSDPIHKAANRDKFKQFVNTLSSVQLDESGQKVLVLKKRYRDTAANVDAPKLSLTLSIIDKPKRRKKHANAGKFEDQGTSQEYIEQPGEDISGASGSGDSVMQARDQSRSSPSAYEGASGGDEASATVKSGEMILCNVSEEETMCSGAAASSENVEDCDESEVVFDTKTITIEEGISIEQDEVLSAPEMESSNVLTSPEEVMCPKKFSKDVFFPPISEEQKEEFKKPTAAAEATGLNVMDRARHLNKVTTESDLKAVLVKRNDQKVPMRSTGKREEDSSAVASVHVSLDDISRQWMLAASACDYQAMARLLQARPGLAGSRDFVTGYTGLHWAAKFGSSDVVKLLCGQQAPVNSRTNTGQTALHIASQFGWEEVMELLTKTYGADATIRDYSGRMAKHYLSISASAYMNPEQTVPHVVIDLLQGGGIAHEAGLQQNGSQRHRSASSFFGNLHLNIPRLRGSWASDRSSEGEGSPAESPLGSPRAKRSESAQFHGLTLLSRKHSLQEPSEMPPPAAAPPRRKRSTRRVDQASSDSEINFQSGEEVCIAKAKSMFL